MKVYDVFYTVEVIRHIQVAAKDRGQAFDIGYAEAYRDEDCTGIDAVSGTVRWVKGEARVLKGVDHES